MAGTQEEAVVVLADIVRLWWANPRRLVAHRADLASRTDGFTWRPKTRSPAFQRAVSLLVEVSTEALALAWVVAWMSDRPPGAWVDAALPAWLVVQGLVLALVLAWEGRGRTAVRVVRATSEHLRVDRRTYPMAHLVDVGVRVAGWGPWRTAELRLTTQDHGVLRVAADGDDDASLTTIAQRLERWGDTGARRAG